MQKRIVVVFLMLIFSIAVLISTKENTNHDQTVISESQRQKTAFLPAKSNVKGFNPKDPYFNDKVIEDVKSSFKKELSLLKDNDETIDYTLKDLQNAQVAIGKIDSHLESLISLFMGNSYGERRLYITTGEKPTSTYENTFVGYLVYKTIEGENILKIVRRGAKKWEVVEVIER